MANAPIYNSQNQITGYQSGLNATTAGSTNSGQTFQGSGGFVNSQGGYQGSPVTSSPMYNPASVVSPVKASTPVVTAQQAQADYDAKFAAYQDMTGQISAQAGSKATAAQLSAQQKAQQDLQASETSLKQQGIDIQKQQADAQQQEAQAKQRALSMANGETAQPQNPAPTVPSQTAPTQGANPPAVPSDTATQGINTATSQYSQGLQQIQQAKDQATQQSLTQLNSLLQGTIPLSQPQAALIGSLQSQLVQNTTIQNQANQSYTGAVSESAFRSGGEYTSQEMAGAVANAISLGVSKIQMLDNSAATTIANLEQGFQKQDFDIVNQQYSTLMKSLDDRSAALTDTYQATTKALADQRTYSLQLAQFQQAQYKDAAQLAQSNTEFRDAHDQFGNVVGTEVYDKTTGKILGSTAQPDGNGGYAASQIPTVGIRSDGTPDPSDQQSFLQTVPQQYRQLVANVANYQSNPTALSPKTKSQIEAWASQYDPTYDSKQYASRQALVTSFTSGKYSVNKNALNTAVGHLIDLDSNFAKLGNVGFTPFNYAKNATESTFGSPNVVTASTNINAAVGELASTFKTGGATDTEIKNIGSISPNSSPAQAKAFIQTGIQLLASRLQALQDTYASGMGKPPATNFLSPSNVAQLSKLKDAGYQVDIQGVPYTDPVAYATASPDNADELQSVRSQFPNLSPADALAQAQYNQSQGQ